MGTGMSRWFTISWLTVTVSSRSLAASMSALTCACASASAPNGPTHEMSTLDSSESCTLVVSDRASFRSMIASSGS